MVLLQDFLIISKKSHNCNIGCDKSYIILKFDRCLSSSAAETPAKIRAICLTYAQILWL